MRSDESPTDDRPPDGHGQLPEDHPILDDLRRAGEIVRRINERHTHGTTKR